MRRLLLLLLAMLPGAAGAVAITYQGDLSDGTPQPGLVTNDGYSDNQFAAYWQFYATAGSTVTVTVERSETDHDPVLRVWSGTYADTADLGTELAEGDDELATPDLSETRR